MEVILLVKKKDSYEYGLFSELEQSGLLEIFFGVAKCYLILGNENENKSTNGEIFETVDDSYLKEITYDKDILTETEVFLKNGIIFFFFIYIF